MPAITAKDDKQYGSAANGPHVASGFDCEVKRLTPHQAIACVTAVGTDREWMCLCDVDPDTDLQCLAVEIARCPELGNEGWAFNQSAADDGWDRLAERWNAVTIDWSSTGVANVTFRHDTGIDGQPIIVAECGSASALYLVNEARYSADPADTDECPCTEDGCWPDPPVTQLSC